MAAWEAMAPVQHLVWFDDNIRWFVVLPLAARISQAKPAAVTFVERGSGKIFNLGAGVPSAEISGHGQLLLEALWGRHRPVEVAGDQTAAEIWLTLVGRAYGGRLPVEPSRSERRALLAWPASHSSAMATPRSAAIAARFAAPHDRSRPEALADSAPGSVRPHRAPAR